MTKDPRPEVKARPGIIRFELVKSAIGLRLNGRDWGDRMAAKRKIDYESPEKLLLDPLNPRLGRHFTEGKPTQSELLDKMKSFTLDELALSIADSGFWHQEPLIVVEEKLPNSRDSKPKKIVVEGNRRLATVKLLFAARAGEEKSKKWKDLAKSVGKETFTDLQELPYMVASSREEVDAYLGFRHVTGIKEWSPGEKAEFIEKLIDSGKTYDEVRRMIGSSAEAVRRNYIAFKLLRQMEDETEDISIQDVEGRFSILSLGLRNGRIAKFLGINNRADPVEARKPALPETLDNVRSFTLWLFGDEEKGIPPVVPESRDIDAFGKILDNTEAVAYMRGTDRPSFDIAYRIAGGDEEELLDMIRNATYGIQKCLSIVHHHKDRPEVILAVDKLAVDFKQLLFSFPKSKNKYFPGGGDASTS